MTKRSSDHALLALDLLAGNSIGEIIILELRAISPPPRYYFLSIVFAPRARTNRVISRHRASRATKQTRAIVPHVGRIIRASR